MRGGRGMRPLPLHSRYFSTGQPFLSRPFPTFLLPECNLPCPEEQPVVESFASNCSVNASASSHLSFDDTFERSPSAPSPFVHRRNRLSRCNEREPNEDEIGRTWVKFFSTKIVKFFLILSTRENEAEERVVGSKLNDHFFLEDFFWRIFEEKNWGNFLDSSYRFSSNLTTWIVFGRTPKREYFLERENSISTTVAEFQITVHRASNGREMLNRFESNRVEILFSWKRVRERSKKNRSNFQRYLAIACDGRGTFVGPNRKEAEDYWSKFEKHAFQGGVYRLIARVDREKSERANEARDKIKLEQCLPRRFSVYRILPSHFDDHARLSFIREIIYLTLWLYNFTPDSRFNAFQTL